MIKIESLLSFTAVVEHGGISAAAEVKGQTAMAVSKQISNLEAQLGEALFDRTQKRLVLTDFGREFETQSKELLDNYSALGSWLNDRGGKVQGTIKVVAHAPEILTETMIPWISEFMEQYPEIELELDTKKDKITLPNDHYDIYWGVGDYLGELYPGLKRRFLWSGEYGIFASPGYLEKYPELTEVSQLADHQTIGYLHNQPANIILTSDPENEGQFQHHLLPCRLKTVSGIIELAIAGMGLINAHEDQPDMQRAIKKGLLVPVLREHWWRSASVYVYFQNTKPMAPKIRAFLDFFLAKVPDWS